MPRPRPHLSTLLPVLGIWAVVSACEPDVEDIQVAAGAIVVVDAADRKVVLSSPARRIVSLVPSATATLSAMGASSLLVGRTDYDTEEWAAGIASVGGGIEPSLEVIVALEPDLVIGFAGDQDPHTRGRVEALGIPYLAVRPNRIEDIYRTASLIGQAVGYGTAADSLNIAIERDLAATSAHVAEWPRLKVAYVLGGSPPWVSGPGTYIAEVLELLGGDNVFDDLDQLYSAISPEELRRREIDVVLVSTPGEYDESLTPGARIESIGSDLEIPGPDVVEAARRVASVMHGRPLR